MQDARLEYEIRVSAEVTAYLSMRARGSFRRDKVILPHMPYGTLPQPYSGFIQRKLWHIRWHRRGIGFAITEERKDHI